MLHDGFLYVLRCHIMRWTKSSSEDVLFALYWTGCRSAWQPTQFCDQGCIAKICLFTVLFQHCISKSYEESALCYPYSCDTNCLDPREIEFPGLELSLTHWKTLCSRMLKCLFMISELQPWDICCWHVRTDMISFANFACLVSLLVLPDNWDLAKIWLALVFTEQ